MKEYKVGEEITLVVKEKNTTSCFGCFFNSRLGCEQTKDALRCWHRSDGKNVIFVEKGK